MLRAGKLVSSLFLLLFAACELYSAAATALDHSRRFPAWESKLGWILFLLPLVLLVSLFVFYSGRGKIAFWLVSGNVAAYAGFCCLESYLAPDPSASRGAMWQVIGIWVSLFAVAIGAARCLMIESPDNV
jgi:hypothetical protein